MRCGSYCVLIGLLLALPSASPFLRESVSVGQSITLPCSGAPNRVVEWCFKQHKHSDWLPVAELHAGPISPGPDFQGRVESVCEEQPGNYSLVLSPVVYNDEGSYECQYKGSLHGDPLKDVKLDIFDPVNVSIAVGMSASLPCYGGISKRARAVDLDILWKRDGKMVYQLYNNTITTGPGFESRASVSPEQALHGNMSLSIKQTQFSDQGHYQCFYSSPKERGTPDSARLHVTDHPPQILTVKAGEELSVLLRTTDPVRVTFTGPGLDEVLMVNANVTYGEHCGERCEVLGQENTFLLRRVTPEDAGVYTVTDSETNRIISIVSLLISGSLIAPADHEKAELRGSAGDVAAIVVPVLLVLVLLLVIVAVRCVRLGLCVTQGANQGNEPQPDPPPAEPLLSEAEPDPPPAEPLLSEAEPDSCPAEPLPSEAEPDSCPAEPLLSEAKPDPCPRELQEERNTTNGIELDEL